MDDLDLKIIYDYSTGLSKDNIALKHNMTRWRVTHIIYKALPNSNLVIQSLGPEVYYKVLDRINYQRSKYDDDVVEQIHYLRAMGSSYGAIANQLKMPRSSVQYIEENR